MYIYVPHVCLVPKEAVNSHVGAENKTHVLCNKYSYY